MTMQIIHVYTHCFQQRLTGVDRNIADMRASEIKKLRLKTVLQYGWYSKLAND